MSFRPAPKAPAGQNFRSKATSAPDGRARSTEPRGFKKPTKPLGADGAREHRDRPEAPCACGRRHCQYAEMGMVPCPPLPSMDDAPGALGLDITPKRLPARVSAAGFARATSLVEPAVAEHRRAADPDRPRTRVRPGGSEAGGIWRDQVLALWFPGLTDESDDEIPCPITGLDLRPGWHAHHWIEADVLWQHGLAARVVSVVDRRNGEIVEAPAIWHPFIGVPFADQGHMDFTNGALSVPRHLIPQRMWDLARVLDALDPLAGPSWATERLNQDYSA